MEQYRYPSPALLTRLHSPSWQNQLRQSVRLYQALEAEPAAAAELDIILERTEQQLLDFLLAGESSGPAARRLAQVFLEMAQHELFASKAVIRDIARA